MSFRASRLPCHNILIVFLAIYYLQALHKAFIKYSFNSGFIRSFGSHNGRPRLFRHVCTLHSQLRTRSCSNLAISRSRYDLNKSANNGAQFVPIGMPTICRKSCPPNLTYMLSTKNSIILQMSLAVYLLSPFKGSLVK